MKLKDIWELKEEMATEIYEACRKLELNCLSAGIPKAVACEDLCRIGRVKVSIKMEFEE